MDALAEQLNMQFSNSSRPWIIFVLKSCPYSVSAEDMLSNNSKKPYIYRVDRDNKSNATKLIKTICKLQPCRKQYTFTFPAIFYKGEYIGGYDDMKKLPDSH